MTRHIAGLLLTLLIVLTAGHLGYIRGQAPAVGEMVLCTGTGPVSIAIDADGNPTSPHYCPDCALALLAAVTPWQPETPALTGNHTLSFTNADWIGSDARAPTARARAPPVAV